MRKTCETIKQLLNKNYKQFEFPSPLKINADTISDKKEIAQQFNNFFVNIGSKLAETISSKYQTKPFDSYLNDRCFSTFNFVPVTHDEVISPIHKFAPKKSAGYDLISTNLLKESLSTGIFPSKLKIAKVIPLHKKNEKDLLDNNIYYRPISLLPSISKVFERIVYNQLYSYLTINGMLFKSQYGFRKSHSTETAAIELTDTLLQNLDNGEIPIAIFLDLSKAIDTLDHTILFFLKLEQYSIQDTHLNWLISYLSNRLQFVQMGDVLSNTLPISTGVPQGLILGPLLFIMYVNVIHLASNKFNAILYADDTTLVGPLCYFNYNRNINDNNDISNHISAELNAISEWLSSNKLSLNAPKTKYMLFNFPQRRITDIDLSLKINDHRIDHVHAFNFLGTIIHETLKWTRHIDKVANKISRTLGILSKLKHVLPVYTVKTMYAALIVPHFNYNYIIVGFKFKQSVKIGEKKAIKITCGKYNSHREPMFKRLNLLKVDDIFTWQCMSFTINM